MRDSGGNYTLPQGNPAPFGLRPVPSALWNNTFNDVATALSDSLSRSGKGGMLANLAMGGFLVVGLGLGSASAPALSFDGAANTGIYAPSASSVAIATGGSARLTVDNSGTSVAGTLAVTGAATFSNTLSAGATTLSSLAVTNNATVGGTLGVTGAATFSNTVTISGGATSSLRFGDADGSIVYTTGHIRIRGAQISFQNAGGGASYGGISSTGNWTISAPSTGTALTVTGISGQNALTLQDGTASLGFFMNGASGVVIGTGNQALQLRANNQQILQLNTNGTAVFGGNVTIGAHANPRLTLSNNSGTSSAAQLGADSNIGWVGTTLGHPFGILTNNSTRILVGHDGNVVINAPASGTTLALQTVGNALTAEDGTATFALQLSGAGGTTLNQFSNHGLILATNNTPRLVIASGGNVGINAPATGIALSVTGASDQNTVAYFQGGTGSAVVNVNGAGTGAAYLILGNVTNGERARLWAGNDRGLAFSTNGSTPHLLINASGKSAFTGGAYTAVSSVAFSSTPTFDAAVSNYFELGTLTGNVTSMTIGNPSVGQTIVIRVVQDGTGNRTVAVPSGAKVTGNIGATANAASLLTLTYTGASRWEGAWLQLPV